MSEALRQSRSDRVTGDKGDDRDCLRGSICGHRGGKGRRDDDVDTALSNYFFCKRREPIDIPTGVSKLETDIAPFDVSEVAQLGANS